MIDPDLEQLCEVMHDAYEKAAVGAGWDTQAASRKPWAEVPEANKATMRAAVAALLDHLWNTPKRCNNRSCDEILPSSRVARRLYCSETCRWACYHEPVLRRRATTDPDRGVKP